MTTAASFKVGDRVSFVNITETSSAVRFSAKTGVIEKIGNVVVTIKSRGRLYRVHIKDISLEGEASALNQSLMKGPA